MESIGELFKFSANDNTCQCLDYSVILVTASYFKFHVLIN